jgi:GH24 family phage-related lysozyme (muramidase)
MARPLPDTNLPWSIPMEAVGLIANYEGLRLKAYRCPAGVLTCGWGETSDVSAGMVWTKTHADERLCRAIEARVKQVTDLCTQQPTDHELGAMVSLHYNIGHAAFARSSVLKAHNRGDRQSASRAFGLWNQATVNGVRQALPGLTARRAAESALYLKPEEGGPSLRMPQAVESVGKLGASPTMQTGGAAAAVGTISLLSETGQHLGVVGTFADQAKTLIVETIGIPAAAFAPTLLLIFGGIVLWRRYGQRIKGWA